MDTAVDGSTLSRFKLAGYVLHLIYFHSMKRASLYGGQVGTFAGL
jgi:hypothetical protein